MAFFLGLGTGGVFAWVARRAPPERVGSVTGHRRRGRRPRRLLPAARHGRDLRQGLRRATASASSLLAVVAAAALVFTQLGIKASGPRRPDGQSTRPTP